MDSIIYDLISMKQELEFDTEYYHLAEKLEDIIYTLQYEL